MQIEDFIKPSVRKKDSSLNPWMSYVVNLIDFFFVLPGFPVTLSRRAINSGSILEEPNFEINLS